MDFEPTEEEVMEALDRFLDELDRKEEEFENDGEQFVAEVQNHFAQCAAGLLDNQVAADDLD